LLPGKELIYGISITDACVGWEDSRALLDTLADAVRRRRLKEAAAVESE
jgi:3-deoxy-7-phosphoheptulonate synthase